MPKPLKNKNLLIDLQVAQIADIILKTGGIKREKLCKALAIQPKTLERRLALLKEYKKYYLLCERGKPLQLKEAFKPEVKLSNSKKLNTKPKVSNRLYDATFQENVAIIDDALNNREWVRLRDYAALTNKGTEDRVVYPLELIYNGFDVKLLAVSDDNLDNVKTYLVSRMKGVVVQKGKKEKPSVSTKDIRFDHFGMNYSDEKKLMKFTLYMTEYGSEMLKHDFPQFISAIKKTPKSELIVKKINDRTFNYGKKVVIHSCFPAPIARFTIGMLDSFIIKCDQQAGIDYIRNYMRDTIIPCIDTQFVDIL